MNCKKFGDPQKRIPNDFGDLSPFHHVKTLICPTSALDLDRVELKALCLSKFGFKGLSEVLKNLAHNIWNLLSGF